jgi:hypothetical protein
VWQLHFVMQSRQVFYCNVHQKSKEYHCSKSS